MAYAAKIIADSISPSHTRLTTMEVTYPRFVHAEFMTHRLFSRNSASSRAIPIETMLHAVVTDPVLPVWWGKNQSGMQAREELSKKDTTAAQAAWLGARERAILSVTELQAIGLHKQIANRILEPWLWHTVIVSSTDYANFFGLRCHPDAQPEIQKIAYMMRDLYDASKPEPLGNGQWHLPYVNKIESAVLSEETLLKVAVARCARVSYMRHANEGDINADITLHDRLAFAGHWSPFEHVATPGHTRRSNFDGWVQYRKHFGNERRHEYPHGEVI